MYHNKEGHDAYHGIETHASVLADKVQEIEKLEAEAERLETMVRWARADSEALNIENKRYREALDRIANDESCDEGAENIHDWPCMVAKAALDGDND